MDRFSCVDTPRAAWRRATSSASWLLLACSAFATVEVGGQEVRNELGKRLRRFETTWQNAAAERRVAHRPAMQAAVGSFFSLRLGTAARQIDDAWYATRSEGPPSELERWLLSHQLSVRPAVADVSAPELAVRLRPLYETPVPPDDVARPTLKLTLRDAADRVLAERRIAWAEAIQGAEWAPPRIAAAGDYSLVVEWLDGERAHELARAGISRIERLDERLDRLQRGADVLGDGAAARLRATLAEQLSLLRALAAGKPQETDYPAERILRTAEEALATAGGAWGSRAREADQWLVLCQDAGRTHVRVRAPERIDRPLPVLFLFHGAGGSENMFFEACGAGRAVSLGVSRGWLVVAPRQALLGWMALDVEQMLDELESWFPIDRNRTMLVGHSMGVGTVARQVARHPTRIVGAAGIAGGAGFAAGSDETRRVPWFLGAGQHDFGLAPARALARRIREDGGDVEFREYPELEHLVVLQASLDDIFKFLDGAQRKAASR